MSLWSNRQYFDTTIWINALHFANGNLIAHICRYMDFHCEYNSWFASNAVGDYESIICYLNYQRVIYIYILHMWNKYLTVYQLKLLLKWNIHPKSILISMLNLVYIINTIHSNFTLVVLMHTANNTGLHGWLAKSWKLDWSGV